MREKLRTYIDALFQYAPLTLEAVELKEEILQNLNDKFDDLVHEGKSEEAAYNIAVAGVGDISSLIEKLGTRPADAPHPNAYSAEDIEKSKRNSAIFIAIAVMLYITCVLPVIVLEGSKFGLVMMFFMIAGATGLLIYNDMTKKAYKKASESVVENFKEWNSSKQYDKQLYKAVSGALWAIITVAYFIISFATGAWYITWVIFIIGGAAEGILKAVFDLLRK